MVRPKISLIDKQFAYLKKIRRLSIPKLRKLHHYVFDRTRFKLSLPRDCPRDFIEKRLWVYYSARNYHYPKGHSAQIAFRRQAKHILSEAGVSSLGREDEVRSLRREHERFSWDAIKLLSLVEVDRYLAVAGIYVECPEIRKRELLFELYHKPSEDIPSSIIRNNRSARLNNRYVLRDMVIENPQMSYDEFKDAYGERMPTVSRSSFNSTRYQLRKAGYRMPGLKSGPSNAAVIYGKARQ